MKKKKVCIWLRKLYSEHKNKRRLITEFLLNTWFRFSTISLGFPSGSDSKESTAGDIGDTGLIPGLGRSPEGRHGTPLQYSCLENPMDRGAWRLQPTGWQRVRHDWATWHAGVHRWLARGARNEMRYLLFIKSLMEHRLCWGINRKRICPGSRI